MSNFKRTTFLIGDKNHFRKQKTGGFLWIETLPFVEFSDQNLYIDDKKADLGSILSSQGDIKRQLKDIEEQWLNCQAELERIEV